MTDANILQGAIFHEDTGEDTVRMDVVESGQYESQKDSGANRLNASQSKPKQLKDQIKPAAHRVSWQSIISKTFQYGSFAHPDVFDCYDLARCISQLYHQLILSMFRWRFILIYYFDFPPLKFYLRVSWLVLRGFLL